MADTGTVQIVNQIAASKLSLTVLNTDPCCSQPQTGGHLISDLAYGQAGQFSFCRSSWEGCDGKQGYFWVSVINNGVSLGEIGFNMDSHGNLGITFPVPPGNKFNCTLGGSSLGVPTCVFYS
jgi:hypothetical protein